MGLDDKLAAADSAAAAARDAQAKEQPAIAAAAKRFAEVARERKLPQAEIDGHKGWVVSAGYYPLFVTDDGKLHGYRLLNRDSDNSWMSLEAPSEMTASAVEDILVEALRR